ncbi:hypothetical protein LTR66_011812 [Elasticomyces elasticus]|nr:hypothetical protein LTR66_011812 [Elasticomyces elasticus]
MQQPTAFWLDTFPITSALDTPSLIQDLAAYAELRQLTDPYQDSVAQVTEEPAASTIALFLRIHAAADFYSTNQSLMLDPQPVLVDIILDPYLLNIFPRSLAPTAIYIGTLAIGSYFLSGALWRWLINEPVGSTKKPHAD